MFRKNSNLFVLMAVVALATLSFFVFFRIDLTSDGRYSISPQSKELMQSTSETMNLTLYLDGDLNPGFQRLKKSTVELVDELDVFANKGINFQVINPSEASSAQEREKKQA
jgi:ABC-2 type transport system permease protein